jgi:streptogramin lyase
MINTTTHVITEFALPSVFTGQTDPWSIAAGSDGNLWFTAGGTGQYVGKINPATGVVRDFATGASSRPLAITAGSDGNLWFTESGAGVTGSINPASGVVTAYNVPAQQGITSESDGNLWFVDSAMIGVATLATSQVVTT